MIEPKVGQRWRFISKNNDILVELELNTFGSTWGIVLHVYEGDQKFADKILGPQSEEPKFKSSDDIQELLKFNDFSFFWLYLEGQDAPEKTSFEPGLDLGWGWVTILNESLER